jgi:DNA-binding transcriptional LysR family regulator
VELRQLETVRAVVESGSYKKAGERLHLSHPAVHRHVRLLEEELGERIFHRVGRRVQLTETGKRILALGERIRHEINDVVSEIRDLVDLESGELRLGTATTMLMFFLPPVLERFRLKHPKVTIHVSTSTVREIIADVSNGDLDMGIVFTPPEADLPELGTQSELLYEEEFVLAVSSDHPLARRRSVSTEDLQGMSVLTYSRLSAMRQYLERRLASVGVEVRPVMELENEETIAKLLQQSSGAAFLSRRRVTADRIRHFRIRGLLLSCAVCLVHPRTGYLSHAAREFARICQDECRHG